jgi:hypothetical protein
VFGLEVPPAGHLIVAKDGPGPCSAKKGQATIASHVAEADHLLCPALLSITEHGRELVVAVVYVG